MLRTREQSQKPGTVHSDILRQAGFQIFAMIAIAVSVMFVVKLFRAPTGELTAGE